MASTKSKAFKFVWTPNNTKLSKKDYPVNELDKQPGQLDEVSIEDIAKQFMSSAQCKTLKEILKNKNYVNKRPQRFDETPEPKKLKIKALFSALMVQRPVNFDHVMKIVAYWDSRRPMTINVTYNPLVNKYYITDGQHTVMAYAIRAFLGLFPDVNKKDWLDLAINCQVVETADFSFAREHFLGINGDDKLPLTPFDYWKNNVLGKRQDSPNADTLDTYETAFAKQVVLESNNIFPVHQESDDRMKASALVHVNNLDKMNIDDIEFMAKNHSTYWPTEVLDPMEMLPLQELRNKCIKAGAHTDSAEFAEFMRDLNATIKVTAGGFAEFKNLTQRVYPEYYEAAHGDSSKGIPKDASLVLLLKMYKAAGGKYKYAPQSLLGKYSENNTDLFDHLPLAKRKLFK